MAHFWTTFPIFGGKKIFLKKSGPVTHKTSGPVMHNKTRAPNTVLKFQKNLISQSQENFQRRAEGQTLTHRILPARTRDPKIAMWAGQDERIINYEWPYDHGANASEAVQKISTDRNEYRKCSKCNWLHIQNIPINQ